MLEKRSEREKYLSAEEFNALLIRAQTKQRDYLLFALAGNLGLRVGEVVRLRVQDIKKNTIMIPCLKWRKQGQISGRIKKGALPTFYDEIPIPDNLLASLRRFVGEKNEGWVFQGIRCGGSISHLTERAAEKIFLRHARGAGLSPVYSFHALRHYRGAIVYSSTRDLMAVKVLLRHRSVRSSEVYSHMTDQLKKTISDQVGAIMPGKW